MEPQDITLLEDYKRFFEETPVALIRTDIKTGEFLMANKFAAYMFGFDSVEELKENLRTKDLYPNDGDRKKLIATIKKKGFVENYEIEFKLPTKTIYVSARLRINCGGSCIEGSLIDITELVQLRDNQLCALKEIGQKIDKKIATLVS